MISSLALFRKSAFGFSVYTTRINIEPFLQYKRGVEDLHECQWGAFRARDLTVFYYYVSIGR